MDEQTRKQSEQNFHNERERMRREDPKSHDDHYSNRRFYRTTRASQDYVKKWFQENCAGKSVLDYCCGTGDNAIHLAKIGASVVGIDISDMSIDSAREKAQDEGVHDRITFLVRDAEDTGFSDGSFDIIVCDGVLHHLDLQRAFRELARMLKHDGQIICIEALAHNPIINQYRKKTPHLRSPWEIDHILTLPRIHTAYKYFGKVDIRFFHLASLAAIPFIDKPGFDVVLGLLNRVDDVILRIPLVNRLSWQAVFFLSKPLV